MLVVMVSCGNYLAFLFVFGVLWAMIDQICVVNAILISRHDIIVQFS